MFNNTALDVVLGLIFIYLLYSLLATIIQETIAQMLDLRAKMLIKAVRVLLDDRKETSGRWPKRFWNHVTSNLKHFFCPLCDNTFSKAFYSHPNIKYLAQSSWKSKPAYISPNTFSEALIKILRGKDYMGTEPQINAIHRTLFETKTVKFTQPGKEEETVTIEPETLEHLQQLCIDAHRDIDRFEILLNNWFDETMERNTGWYKKQNQWFLLVVGLLLAIGFNMDTIAICNILSKDKAAREQLVQMAVQSTGKYDTLSRQLQRKPFKDSVKVYNNDSSSFTYSYRLRDTLIVSDTALKEAYRTVKADIDKANSVLGLGRMADDSCLYCQRRKDTIEKSNLSYCEKKLAIHYLDSTLCKRIEAKRKWLQWHPLQTGGFTTIAGWLLTALAISLGAPFWFDILNKVVQLRSSVAKPKEADTGGGSSKIDDISSSNKKRVG